jgi:hypothetical protein
MQSNSTAFVEGPSEFTRANSPGVSQEWRDAMFVNQRGSAGLGNLIAVAGLVALYLLTAGLLWQSYRQGGTGDHFLKRVQ